ncbi:hypothetical protein SLS60_002004 [Paraconiothyrium brasiliense]|uniref:Uncharacterized protein n=1 Tax=Paraconiothyrium brasiliense TaxID=300254 RepID=A0ABR3S1G1_9PLEO
MPPSATAHSPSSALNEDIFLKAPGTQLFLNPPRILIIGAGSRGSAYAHAALSSTNSIVAAIAEPIAYKRAEFGRKYIWGEEQPELGQEFEGWQEWVEYEKKRRGSARVGAPKIYHERHLQQGNTGWPVKIVNPEIEEVYTSAGAAAATKQLFKDLSEDYTADTPITEVAARPWFGRCVWEADNDVCDDQCVTITWEDDPLLSENDGRPNLKGRGAKTAQFHMVAFTEKICERRGRIYGTKGEIEYDSTTIKVHDFLTGETKTHKPHLAAGGHGGGDEGLARQFLMAVEAVDSRRMSAANAQREYLGCDLEEAFRSHAMVFAAEDARTKRQVVDWKKWWAEQVEAQLHGL